MDVRPGHEAVPDVASGVHYLLGGKYDQSRTYHRMFAHPQG